MKSRDLFRQEFKEKFSQALKSEDENALSQVFSDFADGVQQSVMDDFHQYKATQDKSILNDRGIRQLTIEETKFYQEVIGALNATNPKQAISDLNIAFPETIIDAVIDDIKSEHPLLAAINFMNTTTLTKIIINKQGAQMATWGALNSAITAELAGAIGKIDLSTCKLSAFMAIAKDMLVAGPQWIDAYVRATLSEAIALALENAIVTGTGKDQPIGMDRDVSDDVTVSGGVYPQKTAKAISDLDIGTYGTLLSELAQAPNGKTRPLNKVLLIVNPKDYFSKVMPATTIRGADGTYRSEIFPFPTEVIQSPAVDEGKAIMGIANKYFMGIGAGGSGGKIEYSDEFRFLDDERVYLTKLYGNGRAIDDNAFILLDISAMTPAQLKVAIINQELKLLMVTSSAGSASGDTDIAVAESITDGNTYKYKTGSTVKLPKFNQILTTGWTEWDGTSDIEAVTGNKIVIAEVNIANECKAIGETIVTAKA